VVAVVVALAALASGCYKALDFDNDNKADVVTATPAGVWRDQAAPSTDPAMYVGASTDRPVPGDWDGDGRADVAVLHPDGTWVTQSGAGTITFPAPPQLPGFSGGQFQMVPVPADYDGDHKTDAAWYRDTDGTWFIDGQTPIVFGHGPTATVGGPGVPANALQDQDFPVPADYDGDGKADLATYNPRTLVWTVRSSRDGTVSAVTMPGAITDLMYPAPGDYDGVHHAQRALFGLAGWRIEGHADPILFGNVVPGSPVGSGSNPYPTVADYDGDGRTDLSYVDTFGVWHIQSSADPTVVTTYTVGPLGSTGPVPVATPTGVVGVTARLTLLQKNCHYSPGDC
jgi:hypothetical protein